MLETHRLAARRGFAWLFADLDLGVAPGEVLVVTGPNGSGKTTLLRILAGLALPTEGEVRWQGERVEPFDARLRECVAFNGHLPALKDELTAEENL
ncbi:MAG TPA: ATP-binding cassette domain-containing protein, partial [Casimicrobiaceae bacterium]